MDYINKILCGNDLEILPKLPAESVNCVTCSPPYWSLRDYGVDPVIWDGDGEFYSESLKIFIPRNCKHEWGNKTITLKHKSGETNPGKEGWFKDRGASDDKGNSFCLKCGAWRGSLGLEPTFELYIKHLCDIFDEVKRVLRKDGTCFVNIGDSYGGSGNASGHTEDTRNLGYKTLEMGATQGNQKTTGQYAKSLLDIPYRFSIEMTNRGWIKRNTIIWHKPNCMPSSAPDRFTVDFEYLFFFTKNNKTLFWTNEKTLKCVDKNPLGIKGIEGKDWEWQKKESSWQRPSRDETFKLPSRKKSKYAKEGYKKVSFWTGHDYWFEQQFEDIKEETKKDKRTVNGYKNIRGRSWDKDPNSLHNPMGSMKVNPQGRNKRCVWIIPTQPFPEAHFAVYPEGLIEIPIKAGCPEFICKKCGKARVKILEPTEEYKKLLGKSWHPHKHDAERGMSETPDKKASCTAEYNFKGYTDCGCNAGWESGITLDPFMGTGTTALVVLKQRKRFIGIEIKQSYIDMSYKRISKVQQNIF